MKDHTVLLINRQNFPMQILSYYLGLLLLLFQQFLQFQKVPVPIFFWNPDVIDVIFKIKNFSSLIGFFAAYYFIFKFQNEIMIINHSNYFAKRRIHMNGDRSRICELPYFGGQSILL